MKLHNAKIATLPLVGAPIPLVPADLEVLAKAEPGSRQTTHVARLKASHHNVARLLAWGMTNKEVAAMTGFTPERVSQLQQAPAMKELIASYKALVEEKQAENIDAYLTLKAQNMIAAERHIADAIAEADANDELLPIKTALAISADGADRLGYGKKTQVTVNHDFAAQLERAIARSQGAKVIEASAVRTEPPRLGPPTIPPLPRPAIPRPTPIAESEQRPLIRRRA